MSLILFRHLRISLPLRQYVSPSVSLCVCARASRSCELVSPSPLFSSLRCFLLPSHCFHFRPSLTSKRSPSLSLRGCRPHQRLCFPFSSSLSFSVLRISLSLPVLCLLSFSAASPHSHTLSLSHAMLLAALDVLWRFFRFVKKSSAAPRVCAGVLKRFVTSVSMNGCRASFFLSSACVFLLLFVL